MNFNEIRGRHDTSVWVRDGSQLNTVIPVDYEAVKQYFGKDDRYHSDQIRQKLNIPVGQAYSSSKKILSEKLVILILAQEDRGKIYWTEQYKVKVDTKVKNRAYATEEAKEEKRLLEHRALWMWASRFLRVFVNELGGRYRVITRPAQLLGESPQNLIFIQTQGSNTTIPSPFVSMGAKVHASPERFIRHTIMELDNAPPSTSTSHADSSDDSIERNVINDIQRPVIHDHDSDTPPSPLSDVEARFVPDKATSEIDKDACHDLSPIKMEDLIGTEENTVGASAEVSDDGRLGDGAKEGDKISKEENAQPMKVVPQRNTKRVVSDEKEKDIEREHIVKRGKEE